MNELKPLIKWAGGKRGEFNNFYHHIPNDIDIIKMLLMIFIKNLLIFIILLKKDILKIFTNL